MGGLELLVVVVFFLVGYWAVDFFWPKKRADVPPPAPAPMAADAAPGDRASWHEILGVPPDATLEQIRMAYEGKCAQIDPARLAGMGPEPTEAALCAARRISDAYDAAVRARS